MVTMKRSLLNALHSKLRHFRSRENRKSGKHKYKFLRLGHQICIILVLPYGDFKVNKLMSPEELVIWFDGYFCGSQ